MWREWRQFPITKIEGVPCAEYFMILVYTNSKERAMLLAVNIDGVILRDNQKVWPSNFTQMRDLLEDELCSTGYIRTFFRGESCVFVYTDGDPCAVYKMAEYDESYATLSNRPLPFLPHELSKKCISEELDCRLELYQTMWSDASKIVNAASDDVEGELSFASFQELCDDGRSTPIFRVRPRIIVDTEIIGEFNALDTVRARVSFANACRIYEKMNWLIGANVSTALSVYNADKTALAVGRLESLILSLLYSRYTDARRAAKRYKVLLSLSELHGKKKIKVASIASYTSKSAAETAATEITNAGNATVQLWNEAAIEEKTSLLNAFNIQSKAAKRDASITAKQTAQALEWLFYNGHITWPSQETSMPWSLKPLLTSAVTMLANTPMYDGKVLPKDVDDYMDWDNDHSQFNQTGVVVTDKPLPADALPLYKTIYDIISASTIVALVMKKVSKIVTAKFSCAKHEFLLSEEEITYVPRRDPTTQPTATHRENDVFSVVSAKAVPDAVLCNYTETDLIEELDWLMKESFSFSMYKISSAVENLIEWGCIERRGGELTLTTKGITVCRYLCGTSLMSATDSLNWDRHLLAVAKSAAPSHVFEMELEDYITDLCSEIRDRVLYLDETGGVPPEELACPLCGSQIAFNPAGTCSCSAPSCAFIIPEKIFGHTISKLDIAQLLTNGTTQIITDFVSKKGAYSARLSLSEDGKLNRSFLSPHKCPFCSSDMSEYAWGVKCQNTDCNFSLNTLICAHRLTDEEQALLFARQETGKIRFINKSNKPFIAKLTLTDDKKLQFVFPTNGKNEEKK